MDNKQYAVIGLGQFGMNVAKNLYQNQQEVLAIDINEGVVNEALNSRFVSQVVCADSTNIHALKGFELQYFNRVILAIGNSLENSILTVLNLFELGVKQIIAKANDSNHGKILNHLGVTQVVYPEAFVAKQIVQKLVQPHILDAFDLGTDYSLLELKVPKSMIGKSLIDSRLRLVYQTSLIAIKRSNDITINPKADQIFTKDDVLVLLGPNEQINNLIKTST